MLAHGAAKAEVISVHQRAIVLYLLALQADVGDPVLPAAVGAAGHIQLELLIELRQALFQLLDQPARKALGLRNGQLAELGACAGNRAAPEHGALDMQADLIELKRQLGCLFVGNVDDKQILRGGSAQRTAAEALGQIGRGLKLLT